MEQIQTKCKELLEEAEYGPAAQSLEPSLVQGGIAAIKAHLEKVGDLRSKAIADGLLTS